MANCEPKPGAKPPEALFERHAELPSDGAAVEMRARLVRLAYRLLWNWHDAEDAVQEALTVASRSRGQLRDPSKWQPWLTRIVVHQCLLERRRIARRQRLKAASPKPAGTRASEAGVVLETRELSEVLKRLIAALPRQQRVALVLRHLEGMDYSSIAGIMEASESTVRGHVRSAREALRETILRRFPEWAAKT